MMVNYEDFKKLELVVAEVLEAERVEGSEKLLKLKVNIGKEERQIIAGVGKEYEPDFLVGKKIIIIANLEPRQLMGLESQGMLLAADNEGHPAILMPEKDVPAGSPVK